MRRRFDEPESLLHHFRNDNFMWTGVFHSGNSLAANQTGIVTASSLNVRTGAGTSYDILQYNNANVLLAKEDKVTILEKLSGWYQVSFVKDNTTLTGFVSSIILRLNRRRLRYLHRQ